MATDSDLLAPGQAARLLGLSPQRVKQLALGGKLAYRQTPLGRIFHRADVERLKAERAGGTPPEAA